MEQDYQTARFALPLLAMGQAQKELTHNEALAAIDALIHPALVSASETVPPATATPGQCWLVGVGGTGQWAGEDGKLAYMTAGGWRFFAPVPGMRLSIGATRMVYAPDGSWNAAPDYSAPSGGGIIDVEARNALSTIAQALVRYGLIVHL